MDNLRLAQESFPVRTVSLAEETATENDVRPMKAWEGMLIVIGVAVGLMCVVLVAKQTILADENKDEEKNEEAPKEEDMEAAMDAPLMEAAAEMAEAM